MTTVVCALGGSGPPERGPPRAEGGPRPFVQGGGVGRGGGGGGMEERMECGEAQEWWLSAVYAIASLLGRWVHARLTSSR
ncbi:unnamed protein product [Boreogadus saida]